jgi:hydrogenase maturation protein HypF
VSAAARREKLKVVAVGGGCAMNGLLMAALRRHLADAGLRLLEARQAPPNDGGLALGQAWAARRIYEERKHVSGNTGASR